jgi:hypothetical protein
MEHFKIAGLGMQKAALIEQISRASDTFAKMLLMGKLKAVQRQIDALNPSPIGEEG